MFNFKIPNRTNMQCGTAAVLSVALTSWLYIRPLGILFFTLFTLWIYQTQCTIRITPPPELSHKYTWTVNYLSEMRINRPAIFYAISSSGLAVLAIVGHLISGATVVLIILLFMIFITAKYNFTLTRIEKDLSLSKPFDVNKELEDEFLPEINESNLFLLERASTLSSLSSIVAEEGDDKSDSGIPSEFLLPDKLPDINENTDEDDDLVPVIEKKQTTNAIAVLDQPKAIEFRKGHFKLDSSISITSSSSEESLSKGLIFPDHTEVDCPTTIDTNYGSSTSELLGLALRTQTQTLLSNSGKMLPSFMSGIVQWSMSAITADSVPTAPTVMVTSIKEIPNTTNKPVVSELDSSDGSDFEILENEDFK